MDVFSKTKRSQVMSHVRGAGNRDTELALIHIFRTHRITGWRRRQRIFGKPDFVFIKLRTAVFVDGCFWHGCPLHGRTPKSNKAFWRVKFTVNTARDRLVDRTLKAKGWTIIRIWEHELARNNEGGLLRRLWRLTKRPGVIVT